MNLAYFVLGVVAGQILNMFILILRTTVQERRKK